MGGRKGGLEKMAGGKQNPSKIEKTAALEAAIGRAYGEVQFFRNVHRGVGEPCSRKFRAAKAKLDRLKKNQLRAAGSRIFSDP